MCFCRNNFRQGGLRGGVHYHPPEIVPTALLALLRLHQVGSHNLRARAKGSALDHHDDLDLSEPGKAFGEPDLRATETDILDFAGHGFAGPDAARIEEATLDWNIHGYTGILAACLPGMSITKVLRDQFSSLHYPRLGGGRDKDPSLFRERIPGLGQHPNKVWEHINWYGNSFR